MFVCAGVGVSEAYRIGAAVILIWRSISGVQMFRGMYVVSAQCQPTVLTSLPVGFSPASPKGPSRCIISCMMIAKEYTSPLALPDLTESSSRRCSGAVHSKPAWQEIMWI